MPYVDKDTIDDMIDALHDMIHSNTLIDKDRVINFVKFYIGPGKRYK